MNKYVLITGASKGIGKEIALIFAKQKRNLVLIARSESLLNELADSLRVFGVEVKIIAIDLLAKNATAQVFEELNNSAIELDTLINNAGFGDAGEFPKLSLEYQLDMMHLNMDIVVKMAYQFLSHTTNVSTKKYILNVASTAAFQAVPYMSIYAATKAFVLSFSEGLREEMKSGNVVVSALCPGSTETDFFKHSENLAKITDKTKGMMMSVESVAQIAVSGLMNNTAVIIPGVANKIGAIGAQLAPRSWSTKLAGKIFKV